jgi:LmbE family N-acetylglucosaminyl deacetylase
MPVESALTRKPLLIVAAHPDDETAGAGGQLAHMPLLGIVHITDGAPRSPSDAKRAGCQTREEYAAARRAELLCAMGVSGLEHTPSLRSLDVVDQEASLELAGIARRLAAILRETSPAAILTHTYEGGHPDHDATVFAVHAACALLPAPPEIFEFAGYHGAPSENDTDTSDGPPRIETGRFLPRQEPGEAIALAAADSERKARMIACFVSQLHMLRHFSVQEERFRAAPVYDFSQPPHPGKLFYEHFDWGMTGERWRSLAAEAAQVLGIPQAL